MITPYLRPCDPKYLITIKVMVREAYILPILKPKLTSRD